MYAMNLVLVVYVTLAVEIMQKILGKMETYVYKYARQQHKTVLNVHFNVFI